MFDQNGTNKKRERIVKNSQCVLFLVKYIYIRRIKMYIPKDKTKRWSIQEKNEIVLLYLDQHMGRA